MQVSHKLGQIGFFEILGPDAGVKATNPEENGVSPVLNGRPGTIPFTSGCQNLGFEFGRG